MRRHRKGRAGCRRAPALLWQEHHNPWTEREHRMSKPSYKKKNLFKMDVFLLFLNLVSLPFAYHVSLIQTLWLFKIPSPVRCHTRAGVCGVSSRSWGRSSLKSQWQRRGVAQPNSSFNNDKTDAKRTQATTNGGGGGSFNKVSGQSFIKFPQKNTEPFSNFFNKKILKFSVFII